MVRIMDTDTGRYIVGEFGAFEEEVLNAQWLPQPLTPQLDLQEKAPVHGSPAAMALDADAFLRAMYLSQE